MQKLKIKLGEVILDALVDENVDYDAEVTSKATEKGEDISDHMKAKPFTVSLSGSMIENAEAKKAALIKYQKEGELLTYIGKATLKSVVITSLQIENPVNNFEGFEYSIRLEEVKVARPETFKISVKNPKTGKQDKKTDSKVKKPTDEGRKQVMRK